MNSLRYKNSLVTWYRFGNGPRPVLCFHGYSENATSYAFFEKFAGTEFSFFAIDLPFHGQTDWKEEGPCSAQDLGNIVGEIMDINKIKPILLGYSIGGRVALSLFQFMPYRFEKLILLAPDGLKVNFWYWLATQTSIGKGLFSLTMKHPGWFFGFLKLLRKLKLVNASLFKFVNYYIKEKNLRDLLYKRWIVLRKLEPDLDRIRSAVHKNNIPVRLVYGKHDRIILLSVGEKFQKGIENHCSITVIPAGHMVLHEKHIHDLLPALHH